MNVTNFFLGGGGRQKPSQILILFFRFQLFGPLESPLPFPCGLSSRRGGGAGPQPALRAPFPAEKPGSATCVGCGSQIHDQFILRVSPDLEWHAACLKCAECSQYLDETCTCFVRDGKTYCKRDYVR